MVPQRRVFIIGPTRAVCVNIREALELTGIETILMREHEEDVRRLARGARDGNGFGILANTGTGKTLALRVIAEEILQHELYPDIVTREHEATEYTWNKANVIVITTGVARNWLRSGIITANDIITIDEIHQTSADLELAMALAKHTGITMIWSSATVDHKVYQEYLNSKEVLICDVFDEKKRAKVYLHEPGRSSPWSLRRNTMADTLEEVLDETFVSRVIRERGGVAVFVTTRKQAEELAREFGEQYSDLRTDFYHGGVYASRLLDYITGTAQPPFVLFMTPAGQSSLNIQHLSMVVVVDEQYRQRVRFGVSVMVKSHVPENDMLQMGGRVNGRVEGSEIHIITERQDLAFHKLQPTSPEFELAGDLERVALTCARLGIDLSELETIGHIDKSTYDKIVVRLKERGIITKDGTLTAYGRRVEPLPTPSAWSELLVQAPNHLVEIVAVCASVGSIWNLVRWKDYPDIHELIIPGSDHLTGYNIFAEALNRFGRIDRGTNGVVDYYFDHGLFDWAKEKKVSAKVIKEIALALRSVLTKMGRRLPSELCKINAELETEFIDLLARVGSLDCVINQTHRDIGTVWTAQHSRCGSGVVLGAIRHWEDKHRAQRASIEGSNIPMEVARHYATRTVTGVEYESTLDCVRVHYKDIFAGQILERDSELVGEVSEELREQAVESFAAALAGQRWVDHPSVTHNKTVCEEVEDYNRRSRGTLGTLSQYALEKFYAEKLEGRYTLTQAHSLDLRLTDEDISQILGVDYTKYKAEIRKVWPDTWTIRGKGYPLTAQGDTHNAYAEIALPADLVKELGEGELPSLGNRVVVRISDPGQTWLAGPLGDVKLRLEDLEAETAECSQQEKVARELLAEVENLWTRIRPSFEEYGLEFMDTLGIEREIRQAREALPEQSWLARTFRFGRRDCEGILEQLQELAGKLRGLEDTYQRRLLCQRQFERALTEHYETCPLCGGTLSMGICRGAHTVELIDFPVEEGVEQEVLLSRIVSDSGTVVAELFCSAGNEMRNRGDVYLLVTHQRGQPWQDKLFDSLRFEDCSRILTEEEAIVRLIKLDKYAYDEEVAGLVEVDGFIPEPLTFFCNPKTSCWEAKAKRVIYVLQFTSSLQPQKDGGQFWCRESLPQAPAINGCKFVIALKEVQTFEELKETKAEVAQ